MNLFRLSTEANLDLEEITSYIFDLNPVAAYHFLDAVDETFELLAEHPMIGRLRSDLGANLRSFPVGNYLIFYVPIINGVDITRIYGGRHLPGVFKG